MAFTEFSEQLTDWRLRESSRRLGGLGTIACIARSFSSSRLIGEQMAQA